MATSTFLDDRNVVVFEHPVVGGSSLDDPISGAGLCFSPDSLVELQPWTMPTS